MIITKLVCALGNLFFKPFISHKISSPKKILLFKSGAIGDVLMTTPLIRVLRKKYPETIIDYLTGNWSAKVLQNNPYLNNVFSMPDESFHAKNPFNKIRLLIKIKKQKYDTAFILDKSWLANLFILATGISQRIGFNRFGEGFSNNYNVNYGVIKHEIEYYLELLKAFNLTEKNTKLDLFPLKTDLEFAHLFIKKNKLEKKTIIGVIPGGAHNPGRDYDKTRIWPKENYVELIKKLQNKHTIFLFGGNNDKKLHEDIKARLDHHKNIYDFAGKTSIYQTAALINYCKKIICNDSGPMHIAASMNKPVITIFGCTHPKRKAPLTKGSKAIWKNEKKYDARVDLYTTNYGEGKDWFSDTKVEDVFSVVEF
ncbi:lipopolysaccharide heptosyltransferase II [Candidatus Woesearchaeota archaeon]|nr:lipopolysaccharide heptosyltransferase II [Candidatus Woesearchaeota archaeon]